MQVAISPSMLDGTWVSLRATPTDANLPVAESARVPNSQPDRMLSTPMLEHTAVYHCEIVIWPDEHGDAEIVRLPMGDPLGAPMFAGQYIDLLSNGADRWASLITRGP